MTCEHCGYVYQVFDHEHELAHLVLCEAYQNLPVAEIVNGKEFYRSATHPWILIEIVRPGETL
jgi:hypothetical protein